jgi:serine/threonine protein kinase
MGGGQERSRPKLDASVRRASNEGVPGRTLTSARGADAGPSVREGDVLAGKYRVERVLGSGGMGVVVAAHHIMLDEKVALKFLLPDAVVNPDSVARFVREARAATKIKNEHVARVTDVGILDGGSPYMVMEYLEGHDLAAWLEQRGALPVEQAVDFVLQACEAIAEAHTLGIVHRDLKPANLFSVKKPDGTLSVKVLDFGISKITTPGASAHHLTKTSTFLGSPSYMSPEQMKLSKNVDERSDIWSLGVILFELLTGRTPFDAEGVTELAIKVATEPCPSVSTLRADVPAGLADVITRCLEKAPAQRYQSIGELALALQAFGSPRARISVDGIVGTLKNRPPIARAAETSQTEALATAPQASNVTKLSDPGSFASTESAASLPRSSTGPGLTARASAVGATTAQPVSSERSIPEPSRDRRGRLMAMGALAAAVVAGGVFVVVSRPSRSAPEAAVVSVAPPPAVSVVPSAVETAAPAPPPTATGSAAPPLTAAPVLPPPVPTSMASAVRPLPPGRPAQPPPPNCNPPTWTDARGLIHMKPGCK